MRVAVRLVRAHRPAQDDHARRRRDRARHRLAAPGAYGARREPVLPEDLRQQTEPLSLRVLNDQNRVRYGCCRACRADDESSSKSAATILS